MNKPTKYTKKKPTNQPMKQQPQNINLTKRLKDETCHMYTSEKKNKNTPSVYYIVSSIYLFSDVSMTSKEK